eukprot:CAMPEP_0174719082 /NCGR_PEP_ID=MMETSP1094-20130205/30781_1 /TAXON_ID=156173 /ORGANISM="Chrysochromulina brevifilum, Strain UTEX LB 985" /LENGTH=167 /DNA_ID=CAMNT_0015919343 /DNA_START=44 /DNA_END=550 /DNA_ORIENTATION=-
MLLRPSLCTLSHILTHALDAPHPRTLDRDHYLGDQPILNTVFKGHTLELSSLIPPRDIDTHPHRYASWSSSYCRYPSLSPPTPNTTEILYAFAHLLGTKPYHCPRRIDCNQQYRCPRGHAAFWRAFSAMPLSDQRACMDYGGSLSAAEAVHTSLGIAQAAGARRPAG